MAKNFQEKAKPTPGNEWSYAGGSKSVLFDEVKEKSDTASQPSTIAN